MMLSQEHLAYMYDTNTHVATVAVNERMDPIGVYVMTPCYLKDLDSGVRYFTADKKFFTKEEYIKLIEGEFE